jgi:hypothetical protein
VQTGQDDDHLHPPKLLDHAEALIEYGAADDLFPATTIPTTPPSVTSPPTSSVTVTSSNVATSTSSPTTAPIFVPASVRASNSTSAVVQAQLPATGSAAVEHAGYAASFALVGAILIAASRHHRKAAR